MKSFDILVQARTVQNDVTVRRRLIQNDAVVNSRLTACDVIVPKVLTRSMQDYIDVSNGVAFLAWPVSTAAVKAVSSGDTMCAAIAAEIMESAEKYASAAHIPLVIDASAALSSSFSPDIQGNSIVVGCICDAVMRRLRKLNEVDAMGTLGDIDEMALDEIDYLEQ